MARSRRTFIQTLLAAGGLVWGSSMLTPRIVRGAVAGGPQPAAKLDLAIARFTGERRPIESDRITITAPDTAEDGAVIPVTVQSTLPVAEEIALFVEKNPFPLAAHFRLAKNTQAFVSLRLKMNETGDVVAIVKAEDRFYSQRQRVNVVVGGCG